MAEVVYMPALPPVVQVPAVVPVAWDERELSVTSTSYVTKKMCRLVKDVLTLNPSKLLVRAELYNTVGANTYMGLFIDGASTPSLEIKTTATAYTVVVGGVDITSLSQGTHLLEFQMKVESGAGYNRILEVLVQ